MSNQPPPPGPPEGWEPQPQWEGIERPTEAQWPTQGPQWGTQRQQPGWGTSGRHYSRHNRHSGRVGGSSRLSKRREAVPACPQSVVTVAQ